MREVKFRAWVKGDNPTKRNGKGWYKAGGYIMQYAKYHPHANSRGYVPEHRLIMENQLGRYLIPRKELVHHMNEVRDDNRLKNLKLSNPKDHAKGHVGERNTNGQFACNSTEFSAKKFRLYDLDRGITQIYTLNELISKTFRRGMFEYKGESTGLKDKNGVEIFEGDIISNGDDVFSVKICGYYSKTSAGFGVNYSPNGDESLFSIEPDPFGVERNLDVIGNIHENPELLESDNE